MSRTEDKGAIALGRTDARDDEPELDELSGVKASVSLRISEPSGQSHAPDELERTRLISELARLIREPTVPEPTRLAGLTLIGWLARRRGDESPHAIGIEEARRSQRRLRAARTKPR